MTNTDLAELIERTVKNIDKYFLRRGINKVGSQYMAPTAPGSPAEASQLQRLQDLHDRMMDAQVEVRKSARLLAPELERINEDSTALLKLLHFVDGGGGPDNAYPMWADLKASLQRLATRLRNQAACAISPSAQAILARAREKHQQDVALQHASLEEEARNRRAYEAWDRVRNFRGDRIPRGLEGDALLRRFAELLVELGGVLESDGWQERVDTIIADSDPKVFALEILRAAMKGDPDAVVKLIEDADGAFFQLGLPATHYLREVLMFEVLGIRPAPVPPLGWEGPFHEPVETVNDFIAWIDGETMIHSFAMHNRGNSPSDGRLVRNAFRLVMKLGLKSMPQEPYGPFTPNTELAVLRNLRRICTDWSDCNSAGEYDERGQERVGVGGIGNNGNSGNPPLSVRQLTTLEAMFELKAVDPDTRQTTEVIAEKAEGKSVDPAGFKEPIAELVSLGLIKTKRGRAGGCWLTVQGRERVERLRKK